MSDGLIFNEAGELTGIMLTSDRQTNSIRLWRVIGLLGLNKRKLPEKVDTKNKKKPKKENYKLEY